MPERPYIERLAKITNYLVKVPSFFGLSTSTYFLTLYISEAGAASVFRVRVKWEETSSLIDTLERAAYSDWVPQLKWLKCVHLRPVFSIGNDR